MTQDQFTAVITEHYTKLHGKARSLWQDEGEDLLQTVLLELWPHAERIRAVSTFYRYLDWRSKDWHSHGEPGNPRHFLVYIGAQLKDGEDAPLAAMEAADALARLEPEDRALARARFMDGATREQVAQELGITVEAVRHREKLVRKQLSALLGGDE